MKCEVYRGRGPERNCWRWRIRAKNGRKIAVAGEAFHSESNAWRAARSLVKQLVRAAAHGEIRFERKPARGQNIGG